MDVQVLVAAMNQDDYSILDKLNIQSDVIVGNQCEHNSIKEFEYKGYKAVFLNFAERGVGLNRNNALMRAAGDICLFADDAVLDTDSCIYTGRECQVGIVLKHNGMTLVQGTDYTVQYQNHVNAGTAVIKVTGQNNYTGSFTKTFKITSRDASDVKITPVASQTYTGRAVTPSLRIIYDGKELVQGRDYTVVCKNNVRLGKGTDTS